AGQPFVPVTCDLRYAILEADRTPVATMPGVGSHGSLGTLRPTGLRASGRRRRIAIFACTVRGMVPKIRCGGGDDTCQRLVVWRGLSRSWLRSCCCSWPL